MDKFLLVDANIAYPLLVSVPETAKSRSLYEANSVWVSESLILIELLNILAKYVRWNRIQQIDAVHGLEDAMKIFRPSRLRTVEHSEALEFALRYSVSGYDARYLALAQKLEVKLVTEDKPLRKAAPELTMSLDEALAQ